MDEIIDPEALTTIRAPKLFQCSMCPSAFTRNSGRNQHYRHVHKNTGGNGEQLAPPIANIPPKLYYSCLICAKSFTKKRSRDIHFEKIHNRDENAKKEPEQNLVPNYECDICGEEFIDESIFLNHKSLHPTYSPRMEQHDSVYECEICDIEFSTNRSRARHYWLVHNGANISEQAEEMSHTKITKSKSPPSPTVEDSENEPTEDETKNKFPCLICSNSYATNFSRSRHIQSVHNGVVVSNEGPRVYIAGRNVQIKSKGDIIPYTIYYPCDICGCVFTRNFARERHYQTIHNGERHYIEVHSGVQEGGAVNETSQSKSVVLKSHKSTYPCIICKKIYFTTYQKRERHYKNVHKKKRQYKNVKLVRTIDKYTLKGHKIYYACGICNVVFTRKQHLDRHIRGAHHGNRSLRIEKGCSGIRPASVVTIDNGFQCDACGEVFDSHLFLVRHKSTKPQDNNGELQAHAAGSSSLSALQVITDDSQSIVVTYVNDDANGGHIGEVNVQLPAVGLAVKNESVESVVIDDDEPGESFFVKGEPEESFFVKGEPEESNFVKCEPEESFSVEDKPVQSFASLHEPEESFILPDEPIESFTIEDDPIESLSVAVEPEENFIVNRTPKESTPESTRKPNRKRSSVERRTSAKSSKSEAFACDICHKIFTTNGSRKRHYEAIHNNDSETFPCGICENSVFSTNASRRRHYRTIHHRHFDDDLLGSNAEEEEELALKLKPNVTCDICHDIFTTNSSLKRHWEAIHNKDSETFPCGICEYSVFSTNSSRLRHYRTFHNSASNEGSNAEEEEALPLKLKPFKTKQPGTTFPCAICKASFTRKGTRERHYRIIHDGARTLDENVKAMVLSVANMRHICDICGDDFDSKLMLDSHKSSEHATNKDIPNAAFSGTAKLNDQLNSEVAVKEENNTDLLLHIVKEEYEVYENSFTQEIVSDNVKNGEDSNDEPANNAFLDTTAKWQYM